MFSAYKSRTTNKDSKVITDSTAVDVCVTPPASQVSAEDAVDPLKTEPKNIVESAYQAPPPTPQSTLLYVPDLRDLRSRHMPAKIPENISFSDSAYSSNGTATSQGFPTQSQTRECVPLKLAGDLYAPFSLGDHARSMNVNQDLSFDESYNIPLDMTDQDFNSWWENFESEG
jgi:hypothetical protein